MKAKNEKNISAVEESAVCRLSEMEVDAIGEILNISMGSAATVLSSIMNKQVVITTPKVTVESFNSIDYHSLEPAIIVKITYVDGIFGSNVMVFRQKDMQMILSELIGEQEDSSEEFTFNEFSISAACEVMNQMMGASATSLSEFLGKPINISTPSASVMDDEHTFMQAVGVQDKENVVVVVFNLSIGDSMKSEFISVMTCDFAKEMVGKCMVEQEQNGMEYGTAREEQKITESPDLIAEEAKGGDFTDMPEQHNNAHTHRPGANNNVIKRPVNIQSVEFPQFTDTKVPTSDPLSNGNINLIMNVPLNVSVEIGRTKKKIKDIMEFCQGTIIELEKQAGAPIDVVVNGQLIARGDVVVIDDSFGVRITEIVGIKDILVNAEKQ